VGRQWKKKLDDTIAHLKFTKSAADECLYILYEKGKVILLVLIYVDNAAAASKDIHRIEWFKHSLQDFFPIKDLGELQHILRIQVTCNHQARTITLNQTAYIQNILIRFGMQDSAPVLTPFTVSCHLSQQQSPTTSEERMAYEEYANGFKYIEGIGAILYATQTRPNIQHAVGVLAKFGACPGKPHLEAFKRVLHYLKGTVGFGLRLGGKDDGIDLIG
jgi:hypothetical protein